MFNNVLIVCHANVCRSPAAEMVFKARHRKTGHSSRLAISFHSAGICAIDGRAMDPVMRGLLAERGVAPGAHRSRRLNPDIVRAADLVLVTEHRQVREVETLESTARGKVLPLGNWEGSDVTDPHGRDEVTYKASLDLIDHLVIGWLDKIC